MLTSEAFSRVVNFYASLKKVPLVSQKNRNIHAVLIVWIDDDNFMKRVCSKSREGLIKEAKRILKEITPAGRSSKASLWRGGKIISSIIRKTKRQPRVK